MSYSGAPDCIANMTAMWSGAGGMWPGESSVRWARAFSLPLRGRSRTLFSHFPDPPGSIPCVAGSSGRNLRSLAAFDLSFHQSRLFFRVSHQFVGARTSGFEFVVTSELPGEGIEITPSSPWIFIVVSNAAERLRTLSRSRCAGVPCKSEGSAICFPVPAIGKISIFSTDLGPSVKRTR